MEKWKNIYNKLLFPPIWLIIVLSIISSAVLTSVFMKGAEQSPVAYVSYAVSAYTLMTICAFFVKTLPKCYQRTRQKIYDHPLGNRYMTNIAFKLRVSLYISLMINLAYSAFKLVTGILYSSFWLGAVAVYYILLSLLRFILLSYIRRDEEKQGILYEWQKYRICGVLLLILNLSLAGIVFQMVWQNKGYMYPGVLIFVVAAYTFYIVTISIIDTVRYRKYNSPVLSASKAIRLVAALVSLLSLETAMLVQFGENEVFRRRMTAITGAGVCSMVLSISIYMIIKASLEIKRLQINDLQI